MKPRLFIGCSVEQLLLARAVQANLEREARVVIWDQGLFQPGQLGLESLTLSLHEFDFAIFIFAPDDLVTLRGQEMGSVRDNVLFELGLFIGQLGRHRCFLVFPNSAPGSGIRMPSDLLGTNVIYHDIGQIAAPLESAVGPACEKILIAMQRVSSQNHALRSGISKRYQRAFLLDRESLQRLETLLAQAGQVQEGDMGIVYHVHREDERFYETVSIEEVLNDQNLPRKRVDCVSLTLKARRLSGTRTTPGGGVAHVSFSRAKKDSYRELCEIQCEVASFDRQWALLLADELESQVQSTFKERLSIRKVVALFLIVLAATLLRSGISGSVGIFILDPSPGYWAGLILGGVALGFVWRASDLNPLLPRWFIRLLGYDAAFLWGEEKNAYERVQKVRHQLFWAVCVGVVALLVLVLMDRIA